MSSACATLMPTCSSTETLSRCSMRRSRWNERIAIIRSSARATGAVSPAVSRFARYCSGMRSDSTSGNCPRIASSPALAADEIGDSGGTYQTIGIVRYSGCSGSAIFQSIAIL